MLHSSLFLAARRRDSSLFLAARRRDSSRLPLSTPASTPRSVIPPSSSPPDVVIPPSSSSPDAVIPPASRCRADADAEISDELGVSKVLFRPYLISASASARQREVGGITASGGEEEGGITASGGEEEGGITDLGVDAGVDSGRREESRRRAARKREESQRRAARKREESRRRAARKREESGGDRGWRYVQQRKARPPEDHEEADIGPCHVVVGGGDTGGHAEGEHEADECLRMIRL
ncbi:uncharacterized protein A4U43_C04F10560 [Asparagus officinalis]|uniref:Uncharacterized protein n=1 Tax=Asparagus officinalis TaxID=4686 RepID=A0A5P1F579_ASPOF|nr:uncharacterized protein A4U43_C04F10560 [Asparagus officinalis]